MLAVYVEELMPLILWTLVYNFPNIYKNYVKLVVQSALNKIKLARGAYYIPYTDKYMHICNITEGIFVLLLRQPGDERSLCW